MTPWWRGRLRPSARLLGLVPVAVLAAGCWSAPVQAAGVSGVRLDRAGAVQVTLFGPCPDVVEVAASVQDRDGATRDRWHARAQAPQQLRDLTLGTAPDGFEVVERWSGDLGVVEEGSLVLRVRDDAGQLLVASRVDLATLRDEGPDHTGAWLLGERGWFTDAGVAALANPDDLVFPVCAVPDPPSGGRTWEDVLGGAVVARF